MGKINQLVRFDWFIKNMFRDKSDFEILEGFLSELFKEDIKIIKILESESNQTEKDQKFNRVDIMVENSKGELVIVEVQNNEEFDFLQRILFGTSKAIVENIGIGKTYNNVKKVLSVSVVYFEVGQGEDYIYHGTTQFRGIHKQDELQLSKEQIALFSKQKPQDIYPEYYLIKAGDFDEKEVKDTLDEWVYFLKTGEIEPDFKAKGIKNAKKKLEIASLPKEQRAAYERDMKDLRNEAARAFTALAKDRFAAEAEKENARRIEEVRLKGLSEGREKGLSEGREKGLSEGREKGLSEGREKGLSEGREKGLSEAKIELAKNMKSDGEPIEKIIRYTGLTRAVIENL
jgi:predicted transposase/invertase (TIGR01784 family)